MLKTIKQSLAAVMTVGLAASAAATTIGVPGTADPWLAGMPNGSTASSGDVAPGQSPALVTGLSFAAGDLLVFSASGSTDHCTSGGCGLAGAEGDANEGPTGHSGGAENGIGNVVSPIDALIGVFLDGSQPSLTAAPSTVLDFSTALARDFASLAPLLKQPFFIGDGRRNDGVTVQTFAVPTGATRLYLGTMDGYGWYNNVGSLTVSVDIQNAVPEPATLPIVAASVLGLLLRRRRPLAG
ncbi:PEP-CTERM sorting domain-containing protein [Accumulibacter sp.]|uniref:PEP-CTERM sorting domain-containing protein n=1 Tax=Accumulibacter sp. TaxID=2053492 RepID=UPI0025E5FBC2|nr:PEP-CTERM sorting domain-containing protein [Accumulibacter sp.]MCM8593787.1 PEP-CTERM sorting domain-containing protein [Accumulibacter sp.]MCM8626715.1 PEP-CTERM sorting domain-containing protein [Accumulibacter sp.]MDS4047928.1 PEP-CTERM sorting domain-containing protein [Accumulibacter sp.]